jgi:hypothetical protein
VGTLLHYAAFGHDKDIVGCRSIGSVHFQPASHERRALPLLMIDCPSLWVIKMAVFSPRTDSIRSKMSKTRPNHVSQGWMHLSPRSYRLTCRRERIERRGRFVKDPNNMFQNAIHSITHAASAHVTSASRINERAIAIFCHSPPENSLNMGIQSTLWSSSREDFTRRLTHKVWEERADYLLFPSSPLRLRRQIPRLLSRSR